MSLAVSLSLHFFTGEQNGPHNMALCKPPTASPTHEVLHQDHMLEQHFSLRGETQCSNTVGQHKDLSNKPGVIMQCSAADKYQGKQKLALMMTSDP